MIIIFVFFFFFYILLFFRFFWITLSVQPVTVINFDIAEKSFVTLKIFDNTGREVASPVDEFKPAGYYTVRFNASGFASGVYYYRLTSDKFCATKKLVIIK
ncbi:MAG TPA: hypothetical protein DCY06_02090 [Bacteroidetes bacterium]|nr:hypothetical protein [Bacteroidota bacterium]